MLHVVPSFHPAHLYGGPITSLYELARAQARAGLDVRVLTSDANGPGRRLADLSGRWVTDFGVPTYYARAILGNDVSAEVALRLPPLLAWADLVHVTALFSPTSALALALALAHRKKVVLSPRGSLMPWALGRGRARKRLALLPMGPLLRRVAGWHATSEEEAAALAPHLGRGAVLQVIENGVHLDGPGGVTDEPPRPRRDPVVTMLGRIDEVKGFDVAIPALAALTRTHPRAVLLVAGPDRDGHRPVVEALARREGVLPSLRFTGMVSGDEKRRVLEETDVLWLCSRMESFGNVVLEALAQGRPVVAVQGTPWRWLDGARVGRFVARDAQAVSAATCALLEEAAQEGLALAARCRDSVRRFGWPEIERRMRALYDLCLVSA